MSRLLRPLYPLFRNRELKITASVQRLNCRIVYQFISKGIGNFYLFFFKHWFYWFCDIHFKRFLSPERIWSLLNFNIIIIITLGSISFKSRINSPRVLHIFNVFESFFMKCLYSLNFNLSAYVFDAVYIEGRHLYYTLYLSAVLLFNQTRFIQKTKFTVMSSYFSFMVFIHYIPICGVNRLLQFIITTIVFTKSWSR